MTVEAASRLVVDAAHGIEAAGATDRGTVRAENQDAWDARLLSGEASVDHDGTGRTAVALVVADGMGGHNGGRECAEAAVAAAMSRIDDPGPFEQRIERAMQDANAAVSGVRDLIGGRPGTTLVVALITGDEAVVGNIGDSRAYVVHDARARALTSDHSWVGEELAAGRLRPEETRHHPRRNVITRAVMGDPVDADITRTEIHDGDTLLLCTDGIWEPLEDDVISHYFTDGGPLLRDVERLCEAAIEAGSRDNVTVVAARAGSQRPGLQ
ncbi:MAG: PP2C family serine/threonine-protein phosphatase [Candidatus Dormibacteria bacterium]